MQVKLVLILLALVLSVLATVSLDTSNDDDFYAMLNDDWYSLLPQDVQDVRTQLITELTPSEPSNSENEVHQMALRRHLFRLGDSHF